MLCFLSAFPARCRGWVAQASFRVSLTTTPPPPSLSPHPPTPPPLELAVAADRDVGGGRPRLPLFGVLAAVAGLGAAQVAGGARQHVGVMAVLLAGAVGGVLRGCEGRILLQSVAGGKERFQTLNSYCSSFLACQSSMQCS